MSIVFWLCRHCMPDGVESLPRTARERRGCSSCFNCGRRPSDDSERGHSFYAVRLDVLLQAARNLHLIIARHRNGDTGFLDRLIAEAQAEREGGSP